MTNADCFQRLCVKDLSDNNFFLENNKNSLFSNKVFNNVNKLILKEKNRLINEEKVLATAINTFFVNIKEGLHIKKDNDSS